MIKTLLFAVIGLHSLVTAEESCNNHESTRFALNPSYGFLESADQTHEGMTKYLLLSFKDKKPAGDEYTVLDSVLSTSKPQLCDSNAISFVVRQSIDSAMLLVMVFDNINRIDTIITYPIEDLKSILPDFIKKGEHLTVQQYPTQENRLYNLNSYLFYHPDSVLFWISPTSSRSNMELGKISADGSYKTLAYSTISGFPRFIGDFSMALYSRQLWSGYWGIEDAQTRIFAYDFVKDTSYTLRVVRGLCNSPQMLHRDDQLFCIWHEPLDFNYLCLVNDSIPQPLDTVVYPVSFVGYKLYQDSIVVRTSNCCDSDYGIQTHAIKR